MIVLAYGGERIFIGDWEPCEDGRAVHLPKHLQHMTECQTKSTVEYLSSKSLKELRKWQDIVFRQLERANTEQSMVNLQQMDRHLAAAVEAKESKDE